MIKQIYICDQCGLETERKDNINFCEILSFSGDTLKQFMVCKNCRGEIERLIVNNFMVIDPEELRK